MIPYIAILIVLIVAILFAVYKRVDTFEIQGIVIQESTKLKTVLDYLDRYESLNKALKEKLESNDSFDEPVTESKAKELAIGYVKDKDGKITYDKPLSEVLLGQIVIDLQMLSNIKDKINQDIAAGKLKKTMTVRELAKIANPDATNQNAPLDLAFLNEVITNQVKSSNAREALINKNLGVGKVAGVNVTDLYGAVGGVKEAIKSSTLESTVDLTKPKEKKPQQNEMAPSTSQEYNQEMEERLAKGIATHLKDSLLAQRSTESVYDDVSCPYASVNSDALAQGNEMQQAKPATPNMSQYIRKDSIPCWNCSLP